MKKLPSNWTSLATLAGLVVIIGVLVNATSLGTSLRNNSKATDQWLQFKSSNFESGNFSEWDQTNASEGTLTIVDMDGSKVAKATQNGSGNSNGHFSRTIWSIPNWGAGTTLRTEARFYLPVGFYASMQGAVQLIGWDTYPDLNNHMRLIIYNSDKKARLFLNDNNSKRDITSTFSISEGVWHKITIEQKIDQTNGWSNVYLDDVLAASGSGDTQSAYPITRIRYGFVAMDDRNQLKPMTLYFDDVSLSLATGAVTTKTPSPTTFTPPPVMPTPSASPVSGTGDVVPPVVDITAPMDKANISRHSTITVGANASDNVGVSKVEFYRDNTWICTDTIAPYSCSWNVPAKPGVTYAVVAKAFDARSNTSSDTITVKAQ